MHGVDTTQGSSQSLPVLQQTNLIEVDSPVTA